MGNKNCCLSQNLIENKSNELLLDSKHEITIIGGHMNEKTINPKDFENFDHDHNLKLINEIIKK